MDLNDAPLEEHYISNGALIDALRQYRLNLVNRKTITDAIGPRVLRKILNMSDYDGGVLLVQTALEPARSRLRVAIRAFIEDKDDLHYILKNNNGTAPPPRPLEPMLRPEVDPTIEKTYTCIEDLTDSLIPYRLELMTQKSVCGLIGDNVCSHILGIPDPYESLEVLISAATRPDRWRLRVELLKFVKSKPELELVLQDPYVEVPAEPTSMDLVVPTQTLRGAHDINVQTPPPTLPPPRQIEAAAPVLRRDVLALTAPPEESRLIPTKQPEPESTSINRTEDGDEDSRTAAVPSRPLPAIDSDKHGDTLTIAAAQTDKGRNVLSKMLGGARVSVTETHVLYPDAEHCVLRYTIILQPGPVRLTAARISLFFAPKKSHISEEYPKILNMYPQEGHVWTTGPEDKVKASTQKTFAMDISAMSYAALNGQISSIKEYHSKSTSTLTVAGNATNHMSINLRESKAGSGIVYGFAFGVLLGLPRSPAANATKGASEGTTRFQAKLEVSVTPSGFRKLVNNRAEVTLEYNGVTQSGQGAVSR